jgi:hypothetical protein
MPPERCKAQGLKPQDWTAKSAVIPRTQCQQTHHRTGADQRRDADPVRRDPPRNPEPKANINMARRRGIGYRNRLRATHRQGGIPK